MADNISGAARNSKRVFQTIMGLIGNSGFTDITSVTTRPGAKQVRKTAARRIWLAAGVPAVDAGSQGTYPLARGDLALDTTNNDAYVVSVAPTANTAATVILLNVTNA